MHPTQPTIPITGYVIGLGLDLGLGLGLGIGLGLELAQQPMAQAKTASVTVIGRNTGSLAATKAEPCAAHLVLSDAADPAAIAARSASLNTRFSALATLIQTGGSCTTSTSPLPRPPPPTAGVAITLPGPILWHKPCRRTF